MGADGGYHGPTRGFFHTKWIREPERASSFAIAVSDGFTVFSILVLVAVVITCVVFKKAVIMRGSSPLLSIISLCGSILALATGLFLAVSELSDFSCTASYWTLPLGLSILIGSVFSKTWRIKRIFFNSKLKSANIRDWRLLIIVASVAIVPVGLLSVMMLMDPPHAVIEPHPTGKK